VNYSAEYWILILKLEFYFYFFPQTLLDFGDLGLRVGAREGGLKAKVLPSHPRTQRWTQIFFISFCTLRLVLSSLIALVLIC
jgi:hypothetical protein